MWQKLHNNWTAFFRNRWVTLLLLLLCFTAWLLMRITFFYQYQTPPNQTIHPSYFAFHEMSQSWDEGKKLGTININRMITNNKRLMTHDYVKETSPDDKQCIYLAQDPGYGVILSAARSIFTRLPDSYVRGATMQFIFDGLLLFGIFATFLRMGVLPAALAGMAYAISPVFSYQTIYPFQYFWEGWLFGAAALSLIWARRCSLSRKTIWAIGLIIFAAAVSGFALWVRSSAIVMAVAFILAFIATPSLRRYIGIFILVFSLTALPQIVRASSVQGHFALSTRMSWHTAFHALGHYPNKFGIEDDDLYAFDVAQNEYGVAYNFCDYGKHDAAIKQKFMQIYEQDPEFVIHSIASRIAVNILMGHNYDRDKYDSLIMLLMCCAGLIFALVRRGEYLFITGIMAIIYITYNIAVGFVYYSAIPYAYVSQLALVLGLPVFGAALGMGINRLFGRREMIEPAGKAPVSRFALVLALVGMIGSAGALAVPSVRQYIFQERAMQNLWVSYAAPNKKDNEKLVKEWEALPPPLKQKFLDRAHTVIEKTDNPARDVSQYITAVYLTIVYFNKDSKDFKTNSIFTIGLQKNDMAQALKAASTSIPGWNIKEVKAISMSDPDSWDGNKVHVVLHPEPRLSESDYQALAAKKFNRYSFDITWLGPYELTARHKGYGCDALRKTLSLYFNGYCEYDPRTGNSPLMPENEQNGLSKSLTSPAKTGF